MKIRVLQRLIVLALAIIAFGCTHNNGDIGTLFGEWTVDNVTIDGERVKDYPYGKIYFRFQKDIVVLAPSYDPNDNRGAFIGRWTRTDRTITFDFNYHLTDGGDSGRIPASLLIPAQTSTTFTVDRETSRQMILTYVDAQGRFISFTLRKII